MENNINRMPLIGDIAPSFKAVTTQGNINFPEDYKGKWVILFSHPADFTNPLHSSDIQRSQFCKSTGDPSSFSVHLPKVSFPLYNAAVSGFLLYMLNFPFQISCA